jgi:hypothetical protein
MHKEQSEREIHMNKRTHAYTHTHIHTGIIPIAGGLMSLTKDWKGLFGEVVPCMMIDFMIHL